jgi:hypothetical protein
MKVSKAVLALALIATSALAAHRLCWLRYRCEVDKDRLNDRLLRALDRPAHEREAIGRASISRLRECADYDEADYHSRFLLGMAAEAAGQKELALSQYRSALQLNERPEIYTRIGVLQLDARQPDEARRNLLRAVTFNAAFVRAVSPPLRTELLDAARNRQERLREAADLRKKR